MRAFDSRPYARPEAAARKLVELATSSEPGRDGRIHIEKLKAPFLYTLKATGPEFGAGIKYPIERGWLELPQSGTHVRLLTPESRLLVGQADIGGVPPHA